MSPRENVPAHCAVANSIDKANVFHERASAQRRIHESFRSVLDPPSEREQPPEAAAAPAFFRDLNLDQIVASIIIGKQEYNLAPFFYRPLKRSRPSSTARRSCGTCKTTPIRTRSMNSPSGCARFAIMSSRRGNSITNTRSRLGRSTPSRSIARPWRNCFPDCAPRRPIRPASPASSLISKPMSRRRRFKSW